MPSCVQRIVCRCCGKSWHPTGADTTCTDCGPEDGTLEFQFDLDAVRSAWREEPLSSRPLSHWRYRELLPLDPRRIPDQWPVGWTPIVDTRRLARELGIAQLLLKDEGRNPTASLKDRASSIGVAHAVERGATTIACASTGNAAISLAGHAALAGLAAKIFVPESASEAKMAQLLVFGATVFAVRGTYDEAYRLCSAACETFGWYNRNCAVNPVLIEGKKTCGLEIAEQCAMMPGHSPASSKQFGARSTRGTELRGVPDWIAVSVGDGCTIAGIWKGMVEMHQVNVIDRAPRLLGVQAAGVAPIDYALGNGRLPDPNDGTTIADGINVPTPRNWRKAVAAIQASQGTIVQVTDDQILSALAQVGRHGLFAEPAAAASVAGIQAAVDAGTIGSGDRVLAVITGSGLKDPASAIQAAGQPFLVEPSLDAVSAALGM